MNNQNQHLGDIVNKSYVVVCAEVFDFHVYMKRVLERKPIAQW